MIDCAFWTCTHEHGIALAATEDIDQNRFVRHEQVKYRYDIIAMTNPPNTTNTKARRCCLPVVHPIAQQRRNPNLS
jgi:hypothetical protein